MALNSLLAAAAGGSETSPDVFHLMLQPYLWLNNGHQQFANYGEQMQAPFALNKTAIVMLLAAVCTCLLFLLGMSRKLVPRGMQNLSELAVAFVDKGIAREAISHGSEKYLPYLTAVFWFIFFCNIMGIIPVIQLPPMARMALPVIVALTTWLIFVITGIVKQGPKYFLNSIFPPGVPWPLYILLTPIELISIFVVRPFSLAVRLFANLLAGHILLATFALMTHFLFLSAPALLKPVGILSLLMLIALTALEFGVAILQAFIFTMLSAVYIDSSMSAEH